MGIISWIIFGLIAGFIASKLVNKQGEGFIVDLILGVVGAFVGGYVARFFNYDGVTGFNLYSLIIAVLGAVIVLFVYHAVTGRRTTY